MVQLLQEAKEYVAKKDMRNLCPVCERPADRQELIKRLGERIRQMKDLTLLAAATEQARREAENRKLLLKRSQETFCEQAKALSSLLKCSSLPVVKKPGVEWKQFGLLLTYQKPSDAVEELGRRLMLSVTPCRKPLLEQRKLNEKSVGQHNAVKGYVDTLRQKLVAAKASETLLAKLKRALEILTQERKNYVEGILENISDEVETLYTTLHPGEGIGKVRFFLRPNMIGSLEFDAQFQNIGELPPQAYYSESHLDTLGICVFLALSKHFKSSETVVILDDVLTSVDGPHLDRFMALLHDQALQL